MSKFKRNFGTEQTDKTPQAAGNYCPSCGKIGFAALRVMVTRPGGGVAFTVCFKKQCVYCGFIPKFTAKDGGGRKIAGPMFFVPFATRPGYSVKYRDFYFPPQLYQTQDAKADVALKARLAAALVRLAIKEPRRTVFSWEECWAEVDKKLEI